MFLLSHLNFKRISAPFWILTVILEALHLLLICLIINVCVCVCVCFCIRILLELQYPMWLPLAITDYWNLNLNWLKLSSSSVSLFTCSQWLLLPSLQKVLLDSAAWKSGQCGLTIFPVNIILVDTQEIVNDCWLNK